MTHAEIAARRLTNQGLARPIDGTPADVVRRLGAVQAQEPEPSAWALGLRLEGSKAPDIERALVEGKILRTHTMRPTWHYVAAEDLRWLLALTKPRIDGISAYYRQAGLDDATFNKAKDTIAKALENHNYLTRNGLRPILEAAGVHTDGPLRLGYLLIRAEVDGLICSAPRQGKQHAYALLEERVPPAPFLDAEEATVELARRFFRSHGPATANDFAKWSGLTVAYGKSALETLKGEFEQTTVEGKTYAVPDGQPIPGPVAHLLPIYDELTIGFADHSAVFEGNVSDLVFANPLLVNGRVAGTWRRTLKAKSVTVETNTLRPLKDDENQAVREAAQRYADFLDLRLELAN